MPRGKKQQGRKGKGLWVTLSPSISGVPTVDNELGIVCLFAVGVKSHSRVPSYSDSRVTKHLPVLKYENGALRYRVLSLSTAAKQI